METLSIGLVSREFPSETYYGGIAEHNWLLANELANKGHRIEVISTTIKKQHSYSINGFKVTRIPEKKDQYYSFIQHANAVRKLLQKRRFDVIEVPEWKAEAFFLTDCFSIVTRCHSPLFMINRSQPKNRWDTDKLQETLEMIQTKSSIGVISPSQSLARDIKKEWGVQSIKVIPSGIKNIDVQPKIIDSKSKTRILYIGRIEYRKGVLDLAKATKELSKTHDFEIVFIGKDTVYAGVSMIKSIKEINSKAIIYPSVSRELVYETMQQASFIVIPAHWDNLPLTCMQTMNCEVPAIVSDAGGLSELIQNKKNGIVFKSMNIESLKEAIVFAIENPELMRKFALNAKKDIKNNYSIEKNTQKTVEFYRSLLK
ncbi:MAG: glycosyltransferase family 4 protein [archaeon]|jgi:glycosyltransferase involved in cell wall biosynthesis